METLKLKKVCNCCGRTEMDARFGGRTPTGKPIYYREKIEMFFVSLFTSSLVAAWSGMHQLLSIKLFVRLYFEKRICPNALHKQDKAKQTSPKYVSS